MPILPLKKVSLLALNNQRDQILKDLQNFGQLHISKVEALSDTDDTQIPLEGLEAESLNTQINQLQDTIKRLLPFDKRDKPFMAPKPELTIDELEKVFSRKDEIFHTVELARQYNEERLDLRSELIRMESAHTMMVPWRGMEVDVREIADTSGCNIVAGTVPVIEFQQFEDGVAELDQVEIIKIFTDREFDYILMAFHNSAHEDMTALMSRCSFSKVTFLFDEGMPKTYLKSLEDRMNSIHIQVHEIDKKEKALVKHLTDLEQLYDAMSLRLDKVQQIQKFGGTDYVFMMEGWIPEHLQDELNEVVNKAAGEAHELIISDPSDDEEPPTLYENRRAIAPFESVSNMFGTTRSNSVDPNIAMAPFFAIFFGMMLSDAGYGLILAIAATFVYYRTRSSSGKGNQLVAVLAISGVFTVIWGLMYGGFMGFAIKPILFNPLEAPMETLGLCLLLGVVHLVVGMVVRAVAYIQRGQIMLAVSQQFTWIAFIVGLVVFAFPMTFSFVGKVPSNAVVIAGKIGQYVMYAGLAGIVLLGGYGKKGLGRIFGGISSLTDITGFLSDVLSYARLFGLGLATGVIGMVINTMMGMLAKGVIGWIAVIILFPAIHIFNLGINGLGAYVHSSRLQYVEFFGKFFEDGGKPFKRFEPKTKYYNVK